MTARRRDPRIVRQRGTGEGNRCARRSATNVASVRSGAVGATSTICAKGLRHFVLP